MLENTSKEVPLYMRCSKLEKTHNSFLDYLESDKFYDRIYGSIFSWCLRNKELLLDKIDGSNVSYITEIEDLELDFKNVWIDSKSDIKIEFDIAIEVTASVEGVSGKHHDRDSYCSRTWVMVSCSGSLDKKLSDFYIIGVDEYNKSSPKKPLSGDLVPFIPRSKYDEYANEILEKFYFPYNPEAKKDPAPINMDELANRMGLSVINTSISENRSIFGQIFFADTEVIIYNSSKSLNEKRLIKKNTMLVDDKAAYLRSFGSRNMTVAHECVHAYYHRKAFLFARMFNKNLRYIQCQVNGEMKNAESNTTAQWMEIQANGIAPYILMPKESFEAYAKLLFNLYNKESQIGTNGINNIVQSLAVTYDVTVYAARKRLIDIGFEEATGAFNWVDGHYVRPYSFKRGSLGYNETFTISYKDVYRKVISDFRLSAHIWNNIYVFVENHLCINHPNYIVKDENGNTILTDYALLHMDECCVKFKYHSIKSFAEGYDLGLMCYLSRDTSKEIEFDLEISGVATPKDEGLFTERYRVHTDNVAKVMKAIAGLSFGEIVGYIMKYLDITVKELEVDSGLTEKTIRRYINGQNTKPDMKSVVALLRGLNLPPKITQIAISQSGISFRNGHDEDDALYNVLLNLRHASVRDVNNFMKSLGFDPLTKNDS